MEFMRSRIILAIFALETKLVTSFLVLVFYFKKFLNFLFAPAILCWVGRPPDPILGRLGHRER